MDPIHYSRYGDGTHAVRFYEATRQAVDTLIDMIEGLYSDPENNENIYLILDFRNSGMLPLRYFTQELRQLNERYPRHKPAHMAMVLADANIIDVTDALLRTILRRDSVQYFTVMDSAEMWLRLERDKARR